MSVSSSTGKLRLSQYLGQIGTVVEVECAFSKKRRGGGSRGSIEGWL